MIELDHQFLLLINGFHTSFLDAWMWLISAKLVWIPFYLSVIFMVWKNRGWRGVGELLLLVGVMMLFTDMLNSQVVRPFFHRLRPANLESPVGELVHVVNGYRGGRYGFPSAHAANYWGLSLIIFYFVRSKRLLISLATLTLIVCYSRSYLGVHYPGDLAAGIIYATLSVGIIVGLHHRFLPLQKQQRQTTFDWLPGAVAILTIFVFAVMALLA